MPGTGANFKEYGTGDMGVITNILVTDLGTQPIGNGIDYGETLKATYQGVLYFYNQDTGEFDFTRTLKN